MSLLPQSTVLPVEICIGSPEYLSYGIEFDGLFIASIFANPKVKSHTHHISASNLMLWQCIHKSLGNFGGKGRRGHGRHQNVKEDFPFEENSSELPRLVVFLPV